MLGRSSKERYISDAEAEEMSRKIKTIIEEKGPAFRYTPEFFKTIADERVRRQAYKSIELTGIPNEEEKDILKNPFKYLGLPNTTTFDQIRAAFISYSKVYHPDIVNPQNKRQRELIFGIKPYKLESGENLDEWLKEIAKQHPPETKSVGELDKMTEKERENYRNEHEAYHILEEKYEAVKTEMRVRATKKMQIITKAYKAAKALFSEQVTSGLGGFEWERVIQKSDFLQSLGGPDFDGFQYESLPLEGEGEIRRDVGRFNSSREVYLAYDFGEVYLGGPDYMQRLPLKKFFAWVELRQGRELSPLLLDDIVEYYELNADKAEQLRVMIMNRESPNFIVDALDIEEVEKTHPNYLRWFVEFALLGPEFSHLVGQRDDVQYKLGVEFTKDDGMLLKYVTQESEYNFWCCGKMKQTAHFTPEDVKMMTVLAYGPLLNQMEKI